MAKALSLFHPFVGPFVVGVPSPLLDQAILHAAREFCRYSGCYQEVSTASVSVGTSDYDIDVPADCELVTILAIWHKNSQLTPLATDDIRIATAFRGAVADVAVDTGTPQYFYQKVASEAQFSLYPVPKEAVADGLTVRASFAPLVTASSLPDFLFTQFADDIAHGAVEYLMNLPGYEFSNPVLARHYGALFRDAQGEAKAVMRSGRIRRADYVHPRPFA